MLLILSPSVGGHCLGTTWQLLIYTCCRDKSFTHVVTRNKRTNRNHDFSAGIWVWVSVGSCWPLMFFSLCFFVLMLWLLLCLVIFFLLLCFVLFGCCYLLVVVDFLLLLLICCCSFIVFVIFLLLWLLLLLLVVVSCFCFCASYYCCCCCCCCCCCSPIACFLFWLFFVVPCVLFGLQYPNNTIAPAISEGYLPSFLSQNPFLQIRLSDFCFFFPFSIWSFFHCSFIFF